jgi:Ca-activated chloride channel homolog
MRHVLRGPADGKAAVKAQRLCRAVALFFGLGGFGLLALAQSPEPQPSPRNPPLTVEITSPLGRTGISGPVRIVARVTAAPGAALSPVTFYVDGKLVGEVTNGPPYAVEWADENLYEKREIAVQVADSLGNSARDVVNLEPFEITESASVSGVLVEPMVRDEKGRIAKGLTASDFHVFEDGVPQTLDLVTPTPVPTTYALLVDSSQSMSRRMDFVREAASEFARRLRPDDDVMVVPFSRTLSAVTGPTKDRETLAGAIDSIKSSGGTAILDSLVSVTRQLKDVSSRHVIVLITDGYDEHSGIDFEKSLAAVQADGATVYVIAVGGVAGVSLRGEELLQHIAIQTGGRAFFPARASQLADIRDDIASDVQERYLLTYAPTNQKFDGTWRTITVTTSNPKHKVQARPGYFAPGPPPIRPQLELTATDLNHEFAGISADDLIVLEDGVEQKVEAFEEALAPVSILLVLDASGSMRGDAAQVVEAARSFVGALPAKNSLGVMQFADKPVLVQDLSTKRDSSLAAINEYEAKGGTALYDALWESLARLRTEKARRAIVVLTDGRDEDNPGTGPGSVHSFDDVVKSLAEVDATIFGIGLGPRVDRAPLERLAEASGGEAYFPAEVSSLAADYRRILENLRRRYIIMYTSTNSAHDGGWRKVELRAARPGITFRSKGGYFAPPGEK